MGKEAPNLFSHRTVGYTEHVKMLAIHLLNLNKGTEDLSFIFREAKKWVDPKILSRFLKSEALNLISVLTITLNLELFINNT